jgi:hypothetical protein
MNTPATPLPLHQRACNVYTQLPEYAETGAGALKSACQCRVAPFSGATLASCAEQAQPLIQLSLSPGEVLGDVYLGEEKPHPPIKQPLCQ